MIEINTFGLTQLNHKEIAAFYLNLQKSIKLATTDKLGLSAAVVSKFENALDSMVDCVFAVRTSVYTTSMREADTKRSNIYRRVLLRLQLVEYGDDVRSLVNARDAIETNLLSKYNVSVASLPYQEKSAVLSGFVFDAREKLTEDDIETLGIDNDLTALEQANSAFISAYSSRVKEKSSVDTGRALRMRAELSESYRLICTTVLFYANSDDEALATKTAACQQFISELNVLLGDAKTRYLQRTSNSNEASVTPSDNPDEAKEPSADPVEEEDNPEETPRE